MVDLIMGKYNRLCVSISDETNIKLDSFISDTQKQLKAVNKSMIVEIALRKFFINTDAGRFITDIASGDAE